MPSGTSGCPYLFAFWGRASPTRGWGGWLPDRWVGAEEGRFREIATGGRPVGLPNRPGGKSGGHDVSF